MTDSIKEFGKRLNKTGFFYYAGHGIQREGRNYLIPIGAPVQDESDTRDEAVNLNRVFAEMGKVQNRINIVVLDACRDNRFVSPRLAIIPTAPQGTFIAFCTGPSAVAMDGKGRNSPYTAALLKYIAVLSAPAERVFKNVRKDPIRSTAGKQVPWDTSSLASAFYFNSEKATDIEKGSGVEDTVRRPESERIAMARLPERSSADEKEFVSPTLSAQFVLIPAGTYTMGSPSNEPGRIDNETQHQVTISRPFYMQTTTVTQGQWQKVMGSNPSYFKSCGDECPAERVSWDDVQDFIKKMNSMEGTDKYRLPTEAEWEYAARSGGKAEKYVGTNSESELGNYAWYNASSPTRWDRSVPMAWGCMTCAATSGSGFRTGTGITDQTV